MDMSITALYIFRHGETDWNKELRLQGHTDIPLNSSGILQAQKLEPFIRESALDVILTSDLSRARSTADLVNTSLKAPVIVSNHLRECGMGEAEGLRKEQMAQTFGEDVWSKWTSADPIHADFRFPGGESKVEHLMRLKAYLESYCLSNSHHKAIGVSTHGGSMYRFIHHCEGAPKDAGPFANCTLYKVHFDHKKKSWIYSGKVSPW